MLKHGPMSSVTRVTIVGAGLAGCEAAWQLAERGIDVLLLEQKPLARTPAQTSDAFCELVCSNSLRGADVYFNAVGLLKEELRRAGSLILRAPTLRGFRREARLPWTATSSRPASPSASGPIRV